MSQDSANLNVIEIEQQTPDKLLTAHNESENGEDFHLTTESDSEGHSAQQHHLLLDGSEFEQLAECVLPDGREIKDTLVNFDIFIKLEMLLQSFHSAFYWISVLESVLLLLMMWLFARAPISMWFFVLHLPHGVRAYFGLELYRLIPLSHEVIEHLKPQTDEESAEQINFEQYDIKVGTAVTQIMVNVYAQTEKKFKLYFWLTIGCIVLDLIDTIVQLYRFGTPGNEYSDLVLLGACTWLLVCDFFYFAWAYKSAQNLP